MSNMIKRPKTKLYLDVKSSITRFANVMIEEILKEGFSNQINFVDLDAHADLGEMPETDCITISGVSATFDEKFINATFNIGVTTFDDKEKVRHDKMISYILGHSLPMEVIPLVSSDDGKQIGSFIINEDTEVTPFIKSNVRSLQYVLLTVLSNLTISNQTVDFHTQDLA